MELHLHVTSSYEPIFVHFDVPVISLDSMEKDASTDCMSLSIIFFSLHALNVMSLLIDEHEFSTSQLGSLYLQLARL
jgi:hypothetical protein